MQQAPLRKGFAMTFDRTLLPDPATYFENRDLTLKGSRLAPWKTTTCNFHGGSDSFRVNIKNGAWVCMSCGAKGGDVLSYEMQAYGTDFVQAARALGCWLDDGKPQIQLKPFPLTPRQALSVMAFEATLAAVAAGNIAYGVRLNDTDRARLLRAANRINRLVEAFK